MISFTNFLTLGIVAYIFSCTPARWTSVERVYKETYNRVFQPLLPIFPYEFINGMLFDLDPKKLLPLESVPPVVYIRPDTDVKKALATLKSHWVAQDAVVVWKGFVRGMDQWRDEDYVKKTLNDDTYVFLTNHSNYAAEQTNLKEAMDRMEHLYLGFSYSLLDNNKNTLLKDFLNMLNSWGKDVLDLIPVYKSLHHAFLYKGKAYHTGLHQAPISDWFFQISNSKTWRFIQPKYTPYIKPITLDGVSLNSAYDYLPDDCGIPYVDVNTDAGDMMFFPAHWWHEVHNNHDDFGLAFGFRPKIDVLNAAIDMVFPTFAHKGIVPHRWCFALGTFVSLFSKAVGTRNNVSGVYSRILRFSELTENIQKYVPKWSWDNFPTQEWGTQTCTM